MSQREPRQVKPAAPPAKQAPSLAPAPGNQAVALPANGAAAAPTAPARSLRVQRAQINAIVQRHPIRDGAHVPHGPRDRPHSDAEESDALRAAQEAWATVEARVQNEALPKVSGETGALLPEVQRVKKFLKLQLDISQASARRTHLNSIRQLFQKAEGAAGRVETRMEEQERGEELAAAGVVKARAPGLLLRIEGNAKSAAAAVKDALAAKTTALTERVWNGAKRDQQVAEEQSVLLANVAARVAKHADMATFVQAHRIAADAALNGIKISIAAIERIVTTRRAVDAAEKVVAAQKDLADVEQLLAEEEELTRQFNRDLDAMGERTFGGGKSVQDMRNERAAHEQAVRDAVAQAKLDLAAARDAQARFPGEEGALVKDAQDRAALATLGMGDVASAESQRIDDLQALRTLAQDQARLAKLEAVITDAAKLKGLLEALGVKDLEHWVGSKEIGAAKTIALYDAVGKAGLKTLVEELGGVWLQSVVETFSAADIKELADDAKLGSKVLGELVRRYTATDVKKLITAITLAKVKLLRTSFTHDELNKSLLNVDQLIDLHTKFTAIKLKTWYTDFGEGSIFNFLTEFTADTLNTRITDIGEARFNLLVKTRRLKADALHHYTATFLKDFAGVTDDAMDHLLEAHTTAEGKISGGHETGVFTAELNRIIRHAPPPPQRNGRVTATVEDNATFRKVTYETFYANGAQRTTGAKTLIKGLSADEAAWKRRGDEAIWNSIRLLKCNTATREWGGTSADGFSFGGYLAMDGKSVATFYPE